MMTDRLSDRIADTMYNLYKETEVSLESMGYSWTTRNVIRMSASYSLICVENGHIKFLAGEGENVETIVEVEDVEEESGSA